jgi:hypothetical protein
MADEIFGLDGLTRHVISQHPDGDPLVHLSDAVLASQRLGDLADQLTGHFVDQARRSGAAWSAIGEAMGVTRQAAQQRFVPGLPGLDTRDLRLNRFTPRARSVIAAARQEAGAARHRRVGTGDLLLALLTEPEGLAARAIVALGASPGQIRGQLGARPVPDSVLAPKRMMFAQPAKEAIKLSLRAALDLNHNYIGTEHLLLGILAEGKDTGAKVLNGLGLTEDRAQVWIGQALDEMTAAPDGQPGDA